MIEFHRGWATHAQLEGHLAESLRIEGIDRRPTEREFDALVRFLQVPLVGVSAVWTLQAVLAPGCPLRNRFGADVRVGRYTAPPGGPDMQDRLHACLAAGGTDPYRTYIGFELLQPFLGGNGRTGRAIWVHRMLASLQDPFALPFLHRFYYQALEAAGQ